MQHSVSDCLGKQISLIYCCLSSFGVITVILYGFSIARIWIVTPIMTALERSDPQGLLYIPGPVLKMILRSFLRITPKSKKNSLLRIFLFLE